MAKHLEFGEAGEDLAAAFLTAKGLKIVERRVRFRHGELDIVARDGREWVFVEVKTRHPSRIASAVDAFTARKTGRMTRAVKEYVLRHQLEKEPIRLDLVAIDFDAAGRPEIKHFPAAFTAR